MTDQPTCTNKPEAAPNDVHLPQAPAAAIEDPCCGSCVCALSEMQPGQCGRLVDTNDLHEDDRAYLAALGLRDNGDVRVCRRGRAFVVDVGCPGRSSCRVALAHTLASKVKVETDEATPEPTPESTAEPTAEPTAELSND